MEQVLWQRQLLPTGDANKKPKKCRDYRKGKCKLGDSCPFSHDFDPPSKAKDDDVQKRGNRPDSEKDCINWKTKGKCRKLDKKTCPYRHDPSVQEAALVKLQKKRKGGGGGGDGTAQDNNDGGKNHDNDCKNKKRKGKKIKQPLSIRVFGLNYETKETDVRDMFQRCGPIVKLDFPTFEDSGRSKGYCGVTFQSPNAVDKAVRDFEKAELHGRWLSVQAGHMLLDEWEGGGQQQQQQQPKRQRRHHQHHKPKTPSQQRTKTD